MSDISDDYEVVVRRSWSPPGRNRVTFSEVTLYGMAVDVVIQHLDRAATNGWKGFLVEVGDPKTGEYTAWGVTGVKPAEAKKILGKHFITARNPNQRFWMLCEPEDAGKVVERP